MNHIKAHYYIVVCSIALCVSACNDSSDNNKCSDIDCGGNGVCVQEDNEIRCDCQSGYHNSEDNLFLCVPDFSQEIACANINCGGHGVCVLNKNNQASCNCENNYHNSYDNPLICEPDYIEPASCEGIDCGGHGLCLIDSYNQIKCNCANGYTNSVLDPLLCVQNSILDNACDDFDCSGHGVCLINEYDELYCKCDDGYQNPEGNPMFCWPDSEFEDKCKNIDCSGHGDCVEDWDGLIKCECDTDYHNSRINPLICEPDSEIEISCDDIDCSGHGYCIEDETSIYCSCHLGFKVSEEDATECIIDLDSICYDYDATCVDNTIYRCIDSTWTMIETCTDGLICRVDDYSYLGGLCGVPCSSDSDVDKTGPAICDGNGYYESSICNSLDYGIVYTEGTGSYTECPIGCYAGECIVSDTPEGFDCRNKADGSYCTEIDGVAYQYVCRSKSYTMDQACDEDHPYCFEDYYSANSSTCVSSPSEKYCNGHVCSYENYYPCAGKQDGDHCIMRDGKAYKYNCRNGQYYAGVFYASDYCGESSDNTYCLEYEYENSSGKMESDVTCISEDEVIPEACTDLICDYNKVFQCTGKANGYYVMENNGKTYYYGCTDERYNNSWEACDADKPYVLIFGKYVECMSESMIVKDLCHDKKCIAEEIYPCEGKSNGYYCLNTGDTTRYYLCQDEAFRLYSSGYYAIAQCSDSEPYCISNTNVHQCMTESEVAGLSCSDMICEDQCPEDAYKLKPGICGCGVDDTDSDRDGVADCKDECIYDSKKSKPGICGCGTADVDSDSDGTLDCLDACPKDPLKSADAGICGCGLLDIGDRDCDGVQDEDDACPDDPYKHSESEGECALNDANHNHMIDTYENGDGKDCLKDSDCSSGFCDSFIGYKCSSRCTSDEQCVYSDYYCRGDGRCVPDTFETVWKYYWGSTVVFPVSDATACNFTIDWCDGSEIETYTSCPDTDLQHTYDTSLPEYRVKVKGTLDGWSLDALSSNDKLKLKEIVSFGPVGLGSGAFKSAQSLTKMSKVDIPDANKLTTMFNFFAKTYSDFADIDCDLEKWDVRNVTDFHFTFEQSYYNKPLNHWDVSKATTFYGMFHNSAFNQPLNLWDVSGLESLEYVFNGDTAFNQNLADWNIPETVDYAPSRFGFYMFMGTAMSKENVCDMVSRNAMWKELFDHGKFGINYECE